MDDVIRKFITIGVPALLLFTVAGTTGKTGEAAIGKALEKIGSPFGVQIALIVLVIVGLVANYFSRYLVDGLAVRFYQKRRHLENPENLLIEIDKLPLGDDLKIKLKWTITHNNIRQTNLKHLTLRFFRIAAILSALFSLFGYLGEFNRYFELTAHFRFQYLIIALSCCIFSY